MLDWFDEISPVDADPWGSGGKTTSPEPNGTVCGRPGSRFPNVVHCAESPNVPATGNGSKDTGTLSRFVVMGIVVADPVGSGVNESRIA